MIFAFISLAMSLMSLPLLIAYSVVFQRSKGPGKKVGFFASKSFLAICFIQSFRGTHPPSIIASPVSGIHAPCNEAAGGR